jgi:hypothetical protein
MPGRGNFWEATYDPHWDGPTEEAALDRLDGSTGLVRRRVVAADGKSATVRWRIRDQTPRRFQECDFVLEVRDAFISDCTFDCCRFKSSTWYNVKFSNCTFQHCDFSSMTLIGCYFVNDCRFIGNSASAELFRIDDTAISASAFMLGLQTNVKYLAVGYTQEYQQNHFVRTRQKIAMALFTATRNVANLDYFDEAYEQLVCATLDERVEQHRFNRVTRRQTKQLRFVILSFPARIERMILRISGWLTNWGRSVFRPCLFLLGVVATFSALYASLGHAGGIKDLSSSVLEALNVSLVAGFTAYFSAKAPLLDRVVWACNLILGLFWYSLIIPVLSRRILR